VNCSRTPPGKKNGQPGQACDPARPAGSSSATWVKLGPAQKNKKNICMNKNNINLLVYSRTPESGIKISI
jgi:hypothetical protein